MGIRQLTQYVVSTIIPIIQEETSAFREEHQKEKNHELVLTENSITFLINNILEALNGKLTDINIEISMGELNLPKKELRVLIDMRDTLEANIAGIVGSRELIRSRMQSFSGSLKNLNFE